MNFVYRGFLIYNTYTFFSCQQTSGLHLIHFHIFSSVLLILLPPSRPLGKYSVKFHFLQVWKIPTGISITVVQFLKILAFKTINSQTSLLTWFLQGEELVKCISITELAEKYYCCQFPIDIWKKLIIWYHRVC